MIVKNEKELANAVKNDTETITIEGDLEKKSLESGTQTRQPRL